MKRQHVFRFNAWRMQMKYNYLGLFILLMMMVKIVHAENISVIVQKGTGNKSIVTQKESNAAQQSVVEIINSQTGSGNTAISHQIGKCNLSIQNQNGHTNSAYASTQCK
jgi:hypothetical protein